VAEELRAKWEAVLTDVSSETRAQLEGIASWDVEFSPPAVLHGANSFVHVVQLLSSATNEAEPPLFYVPKVEAILACV